MANTNSKGLIRCRYCPKKSVKRIQFRRQVVNVCWGHYRRILRRGTPERANMRVCDPDTVRRLYRKGLSIREIAQGLEVGKSSVHRALHAAKEDF